MAAEPGSRGPLVVVSGPSGVGKTTLVKALVRRNPAFVLSVSATTRAPRAGEADGVDYRFLDRDEFARLRDAGEFLEWADVYGEWYGTPRQAVEEARSQGKTVVLEIDVQGARAVKRAVPDALAVFVEPPNWETLEQRLERRATEDPASMAVRLRTALREVAAADDFDAVVANDRLGEAVENLEALVRAHSAQE